MNANLLAIECARKKMTAAPHVGRSFHRPGLGMLCLLLIAASSSTAQITGAPQVVAGQATFAQKGNVLAISNTPNTIINWQSFSV